MFGKYLVSMIGLLGLCLPLGCAGEKSVLNELCTIGSDWGPEIGQPTSAARNQLSPTGTVLRVGISNSNRGISTPGGTTPGTSTAPPAGPAIDIACRLATKLNLPLSFTFYSSVPDFNAGFTANEFEIGFSVDTLLASTAQATANSYVAIENTYMVLSESPFQSVNDPDLDKPGVHIGVQIGNSTDLYLTSHLRFATLVHFSTPAAMANALIAPNSALSAVATSRSFLAGFAATHPNARVLPDNLFLATLAPFMHPNNGDGVCYLTDHIERSKVSGLIAQSLGRIVPPLCATCDPLVGFHVSESAAGCANG